MEIIFFGHPDKFEAEYHFGCEPVGSNCQDYYCRGNNDD